MEDVDNIMSEDDDKGQVPSIPRSPGRISEKDIIIAILPPTDGSFIDIIFISIIGAQWKHDYLILIGKCEDQLFFCKSMFFNAMTM